MSKAQIDNKSIKPRVLFVDDQQMILEGIKRVFRTADFELYTATDAPSAMRIIKSKDIDVVVVDELMPLMSGTSFLVILKQQAPWITRIMLSGHAMYSTIQGAINRAEVFRFLAKPYHQKELEVAIIDALEKAKEARKIAQNFGNIEEGTVINELEQAYPGITTLERDENGAIVISDKGEG